MTMSEKPPSIRGIHYEVSKPVQNKVDRYYYQRVRQVDGDGNLVGVGEQIHRSANPDSEDGLIARPIDLGKLGFWRGVSDRRYLQALPETEERPLSP
jgi:hypothetical protein